jgi:hypothetical protein
MIQNRPTPPVQDELAGLHPLEVPTQSQVAELPRNAISQVTELTRGLFGGPVVVNKSRDPEYPDCEYLVFAVDTKLSPSEIVRAECEWIGRVEGIIPNCDSLRLSIRSVT